MNKFSISQVNIHDNGKRLEVDYLSTLDSEIRFDYEDEKCLDFYPIHEVIFMHNQERIGNDIDYDDHRTLNLNDIKSDEDMKKLVYCKILGKIDKSEDSKEIISIIKDKFPKITDRPFRTDLNNGMIEKLSDDVSTSLNEDVLKDLSHMIL